ncbi:MAG: hypothetical protein QNI86_09265 [Halieaceae bacterium]|nr:hypothetical protein [Halieaceae bacterium]
MAVYATRKIRNTAALLMMLSGISHVAQLWYRETNAATLLTALAGMYYLLLALGLSGQSRFTLWISTISVSAGGVMRTGQLGTAAPDPALAWHLAMDLSVAALCLYILYRTRFADMD